MPKELGTLKKSEQLIIMTTVADRKKIEKAARKAELTLSEWARQVIRDAL